jgi:hypothetical protein
MIFLIALSAGCGGVDSQKAEAIVDQYYQAIAAGDTEKAVGLCDPAFFKDSPKDQFRSALDELPGALGAYKSHTRTKWGAVTGSRAMLTMTYQVRYADFRSTETFTFISGEDGKPRLVGLRILSPGLMPGAKKVEEKPTTRRMDEVE